MRLPILLLLFPILAGCAAGYYLQAAKGQLEVWAKRRPIDEVLADPAQPAWLKARLKRALVIRRYASEHLALPDNGSYRSYADLGRPAAVWNVFAAPEFSLEPYRWCYPFIGCASYRGYFQLPAARREAGRLAAAGYDTFVAAVPAYSTLGWFDDPLLNTVIRWEDARLAGLIFHELAHQVVYVRDDTTFNESFASAVERLGVDQWLRERGRPEQRAEYSRYLRHRDAFHALLHRYRERLAARYAKGGDEATLRRAKAALFAELKADYQALKAGWGEGPYFDGWFQGPLNNARFVPVQDYTALLPAFVCLWRSSPDWPAFYGQVKSLADLPREERHQRLEAACSGG